MKCKDIQEMLNEHENGNSPLPQSPSIAEHLAICQDCARAVQQFEQYLKLETQYLDKLKSASAFHDRLMHKIKTSQIVQTQKNELIHACRQPLKRRFYGFLPYAAVAFILLSVSAVLVYLHMENQKRLHINTYTQREGDLRTIFDARDITAQINIYPVYGTILNVKMQDGTSKRFQLDQSAFIDCLEKHF